MSYIKWLYLSLKFILFHSLFIDSRHLLSSRLGSLLMEYSTLFWLFFWQMEGVFLFYLQGGILLIFLECWLRTVYHQLLGQDGGNFFAAFWNLRSVKIGALKGYVKTKFLLEFKAADTSLFSLWEIKIFIKATN